MTSASHSPQREVPFDAGEQGDSVEAGLDEATIMAFPASSGAIVGGVRNSCASGAFERMQFVLDDNGGSFRAASVHRINPALNA